MTNEEKKYYEKKLRDARKNPLLFNGTEKQQEELTNIILDCKSKLGYAKSYSNKGLDSYANVMWI